MLNMNSDFQYTEMFKEFRRKVIATYVKNLKAGKLKVRNLDYWDCMEFRQDGSLNPQGKEIRSVAKKLMLGIMYGMGAKLMASNLGITVEECKVILETFYQMFPNVKAFTEGNEQMARDLGYVEDYLGRRRHLPDINLPEIVVEADRKFAVNGDIFFEEVPNILSVYDE